MVGAKDRNTPKARLLGAELRELRQHAGWNARKLAGELGIAQGTVTRYERGDRTPPVAHVSRVLGVLGVTGRAYEELIEFAENASEPNLVADSGSGLHGHLVELSEYDRSATSITHVAPLIVPGPFQTRAYAQQIMASVPAYDREVRIEMRMARREAIRSERRFTVILAERVLRETIGSRAVMAEQLDHLCATARRDNVSVQVIPASETRWTLAHNGSFVLFEFDKAAPTIHLEHFRGPTFLYEKRDVEAYREELANLRATALEPQDSLELIESVSARVNEENHADLAGQLA
ncbi:helix-turn-helix transcriptional regulator [Saccharopolyspora sp. NPDC047091]|uniref:helix-turn-helix domain-containing protein n=1 Tax=Saccharopolyspora sp. NPDC047091 TaxID=3155924 RepID=UPI003406604C